MEIKDQAILTTPPLKILNRVQTTKYDTKREMFMSRQRIEQKHSKFNTVELTNVRDYLLLGRHAQFLCLNPDYVPKKNLVKFISAIPLMQIIDNFYKNISKKMRKATEEEMEEILTVECHLRGIIIGRRVRKIMKYRGTVLDAVGFQ